MGTFYTVKVVGLVEGAPARALHGRIDTLLAAINRAMSTYDRGSELSRFNANISTDWVTVSPELQRVVATAQEISRMTDGAFDSTVGPLVNLWGFGPTAAATRPPPSAAIRQALARVGYSRLTTRAVPPALRKSHPELEIDLSAIAKGYAIDAIAELLQRYGHRRWLVEIGGELRVGGRNARDELWKVGIERPSLIGHGLSVVVALRDEAVATSGDYRNFYRLADRQYSHMIDPTSGRPVAHDVAAVTVVHGSAMYADALATALLVMGEAGALEVSRAHDLAVLLLMRADEAWRSRASTIFQQRFGDADGGL